VIHAPVDVAIELRTRHGLKVRTSRRSKFELTTLPPRCPGRRGPTLIAIQPCANSVFPTVWPPP
jgi:hypothetical protein